MNPRPILFVMLGAVLGWGPASPPVPFDLEARLAALEPEAPGEYFDLAEEVLDVAEDDPERRALARRLFGLSGVLDRDRFGASAALALAAMSEDPATVQRFRVVARILSSGPVAAEGSAMRPLDRDAVDRICRALGDLRGGKVGRIRGVLRDPSIVQALGRWDATLPGGIEWLRTRSARGSKAGLDLDRRDENALLNVEIALLEGDQASWATLIATGEDRPLMTLSLERPETALLPPQQRDLVYWRHGVWTDHPDRDR